MNGWYVDPLGRYDSRFWDGVSWTARVRIGSIERLDDALPCMPDWAPVTRLCAYGHENLLASETCAQCGAPLARVESNGEEPCTEPDVPAISWSLETVGEGQGGPCATDGHRRRGLLRRLLPGSRRRRSAAAGSDAPPVSV